MAEDVPGIEKPDVVVPGWMTGHLEVIRAWLIDAEQSFSEGDPHTPDFLFGDVREALTAIVDALPDPIAQMDAIIEKLSTEEPPSGDGMEALRMKWRQIRDLYFYRDRMI